MFAVSVIFMVKIDHVESFHDLVHQHAARTLKLEPGCRRFDVGLDVTDATRVFLYELYDDLEAFDQHANSDYVAEFFDAANDWIVSKESDRWLVSNTLT